MKVLITGGGGFVGSHLADAFIGRGDQVFVLDNGSVAKVRHLMGTPGFHYVRDSIFDLEILEGLIAKVDLVYHLAAVVGVGGTFSVSGLHAETTIAKLAMRLKCLDIGGSLRSRFPGFFTLA